MAKKKKRPSPKLEEAVVAIYMQYGCKEVRLFNTEKALLDAINSGSFTATGNKTTRFFRLAGQEVKVNILVQRVPVTKEVSKATGVTEKKKKIK